MTNYRENSCCSTCSSYDCGNCKVLKETVDPGFTCDKHTQKDDGPIHADFYLKEYEKVNNA
jgi:hypothetical protein